MKKTVPLLAALFTVFILSSARAAAADAVLSPQKLAVEGSLVECEMYNIGGSNYFKLRDLAYLLSGTVSRFSVDWNREARTVSIFTGLPYTPDGSELDLSFGDRSSSAVPSGQTVMIDGLVRDDLSVYNIGGNNFFRLRDLGGTLGFFVDYDEATNTAVVKSLADVANPDQWLPGAVFEMTVVGVTGERNTYGADGTLIKNEYAEYPGGFTRVTDYSYDSDGLLVSENCVCSDGVTDSVVYTYDPRGNMLSEQYSSSLGDRHESQYTYDESGNMLSYSYESGSDYGFVYRYSYDGSGNLLSESCENTDGLYYRYDYTYDADGSMLSEKYRSGNGDRYTSLYGYDADGRILYEDYLSDDYSYREEYLYDPDGRLVCDTWLNSDGERYEYRYTYGENGRLISSSYESDDYRTEALFGYNTDGALTREDRFDSDGDSYHILYDRSGNILCELYYSDHHMIWEASSSYDALGNELSYYFRSEYGAAELRLNSYNYAAGTYASLRAVIDPDILI